MTKRAGTDRVAEIRNQLKTEFPDFKFSIRKSGYNGVHIDILSAPVDLMKGKEDKTYTDVNNYYIDEHYKDDPETRDILKRINEIASEGVTYRETGDYGTQPSFYVYIRIGDYGKPFQYIPKKGSKKASPARSSQSSSSTPSSGKKWDRGDVLRECAGWKITKKTLPDGRVVYNATKDKETAPNKGDWNTIKGEIYTETGFKWGRFGAFEKWGEMTANDEGLIFDRMCSVLSKYFASSSTPSTTSTPDSGSKISIYINGSIWEDAQDSMEAWSKIKARYGDKKYEEMEEDSRIVYDIAENRVDILEGEVFTYGKKWDVPKNYGKRLMMKSIYAGFKVYLSAKNNVLVIYKTDMATDGMMIVDNGGEFNLERYGYNEHISSVNYVMDDVPVSDSTLAGMIWNIYNDYFQKTPEQPPSRTLIHVNGAYYATVPSVQRAYEYLEATFSKNKVQELKNDGNIALKNIKNSNDLRMDVIDSKGNIFEYGKNYGVPKKDGKQLMFELAELGFIVDDRFADILMIYKIENTENYLKIYDGRRELIVVKQNDYTVGNIFYDTNVGIKPAEIIAEEIAKIFDREFPSSAPEETKQVDKESIRKAIVGLQILADKGNEKAQKAIKGLTILLNK